MKLHVIPEYGSNNNEFSPKDFEQQILIFPLTITVVSALCVVKSGLSTTSIRMMSSIPMNSSTFDSTKDDITKKSLFRWYQL